jgi:hypothetical protein
VHAIPNMFENDKTGHSQLHRAIRQATDSRTDPDSEFPNADSSAKSWAPAAPV